MGSRDYKDLIVWQKAMNLAQLIYKYTDTFPHSEVFGLTSQMRRCSVSIVSNIAEGSKRSTKKDFQHFLVISYGSAAELETQYLLSKRLAFASGSHEQLELLLSEVLRMLHTMTSNFKSITQ